MRALGSEYLRSCFNPFLQLAAEKKDSKNDAARNFFGPSYFVTALVPVKCKVEISQNFVAFSEYMNFNLSTFFKSLELYLQYGGNGCNTTIWSGGGIVPES